MNSALATCVKSGRACRKNSSNNEDPQYHMQLVFHIRGQVLLEGLQPLAGACSTGPRS